MCVQVAQMMHSMDVLQIWLGIVKRDLIRTVYQTTNAYPNRVCLVSTDQDGEWNHHNHGPTSDDGWDHEDQRFAMACWHDGQEIDPILQDESDHNTMLHGSPILVA